jgi:hypothetical protein
VMSNHSLSITPPMSLGPKIIERNYSMEAIFVLSKLKSALSEVQNKRYIEGKTSTYKKLDRFAVSAWIYDWTREMAKFLTTGDILTLCFNHLHIEFTSDFKANLELGQVISDSFRAMEAYYEAIIVIISPYRDGKGNYPLEFYGELGVAIDEGLDLCINVCEYTKELATMKQASRASFVYSLGASVAASVDSYDSYNSSTPSQMELDYIELLPDIQNDIFDIAEKIKTWREKPHNDMGDVVTLQEIARPITVVVQ